MKNKSIIFILLIGLLGILPSCEKYDDFTNDFDYSAVYFATQKPLRTIVAREEMQIKFGVALSGKRENTKDEWVKFSIDPSLLKTVNGADKFKLLPESYYSMKLRSEKDSTIVIPQGKFLGDIPITFNRALFTSDPLAVNSHYAIPLRIYQTSADSILTGNSVTPSKAYTIIVIKYIAPEHAAYYGNGVEVDENNIETKYEITISTPRWMKTLSANELEIAALGNATTGAKNKLKLVFSVDRKSVAAASTTGGEVVNDLGSTYDLENKTLNLKYNFSRSGKTFTVSETLKLRQEPEKDLRFEEWQ